MKKIIAFFAFMASICACSSGPEIIISNPVDIKIGDPYVLLSSDGHYYMYGTTGGNGYKAYRSDDLQKWEDIGQVYKGHREDGWSVSGYWAPEVFEHNGKFYMFFSAQWKDNPDNELENYRIGVAVADQASGPFTDMYDRPIFDPGYPIIDADVFFDSDGKAYLYFSRCCYKHPVESEIAQWAREQGLYNEIEESWVYGIELKEDFSGVKGEPVLLLCPPQSLSDTQAEWESRSVTNAEANRRWTEGSFMLKHKGTYYIMYSANYFGGENYAIGYATSSSPLGPFAKSDDNPILQKNTAEGGDVTGVGHNSVTWSRDGKHMYCVYHGRTSKTGRSRVVFIDEMEFRKGHLVINGPTTKD